MDAKFSHNTLLVLLTLAISINYSEQLQSSQAQTMLRIQYILNYPSFLNVWSNNTDFCNLPPTPFLTVVCYDESITQLHIIGAKETPRLPENFSIDSFVTTLVKLPNLKVLKLVCLGLWGTLPSKFSRLSSLEILDLSSNFLHGAIPQEIYSMTRLQTLILDGNMFEGRLPERLSSLSVLAVLSMKNNSFSGPLADSVGNLKNLRIIALSNNNFSGEVPDLMNLENLQVLDLGNNSFGPQFPAVNSKIVSLLLGKNRFTYGIPEKVQSYYQLEHLDISSNRFVGPFPTTLLSMPSISHLDISANRLTGMLFEDLPCNIGLEFVNLSANLLTGRLPSCLKSGSRTVQYAGNCLATGDTNQHPLSFCQNEAFAVGIIPHHKRQKQVSTIILALSISGGLIGGILIIGLTVVFLRKYLAKKGAHQSPTRIIEENASSGYTSKSFSDARYTTQAAKLGALDLAPYRIFSLEELQEATNNFDTSAIMGEGSYNQMYRGQQKDGSYVAIRCFKVKRSHRTHNYLHQTEMISKLRHQHLVSALGHCFEYYMDDSKVSRVFVVFEYVQNGNLRSWISGRHAGRRLTWTQRIATAIGVTKGIQFLHTGIMPAGVFPNPLSITDILLDQNLVAKISIYGLPLLGDNLGKDGIQNSPGVSKELMYERGKHQEKYDIFYFGVILLEIILGREIKSKNDALVLKDQLQASLTADGVSKNVFYSVSSGCSNESVKTMIQICCRCLLRDPADRPSVEDVLWNLQFAAQVQDAWRGDSPNSDSSPFSSFQSPQLQLTVPWH